MKLLIIALFLFAEFNYSNAQTAPSDSGYIQFAGNRTIIFTDSSRSNRNISSVVYYPSIAEGSNTPLLTGSKYPVISFGHGFTLNPNLYVSLFRHLASWGYIVIAPSTETGFSPSHLNFAKDLSFVLKDMKRKGRTSGDFFYNSVDTNNTGVFGHSMGGGCSFLAGSLDSTIKAVSSLAAATTNPSSVTAINLIRCPVQLLSGQRDSIASYSTNQLPHFNNAFPFKQIINLKGGNHSQFHQIAGLDDLVDNAATISRAEQQRLTRRYVTSFFNLFLKNDTASKNFLYGTSAGSDTGVIMQFRNFRLNAFIQGFYDPALNSMTSDTAVVYLRNDFPPYIITDSSKSVLNSSGYGEFSFSRASAGISYYYQFKHRNSLETWSRSGGEIFSLSESEYNFSDNIFKAYGNNLKLKGTKYCIFNGEVNTDGIIDLTDLIIVFNEVTNITSGYNITDITGDNFTDLSDLIVVYNNASDFVAKIIP